MLGLFGIGIALMLGILMRVAAVSGGVLMVLMYTAAMPPEHNPIVDDHVIYALLLMALVTIPSSRQIGLGGWWSGLPLVQRWHWLK
jgi:thiosulfate dehydrogenase [quinone] large subunit